MIRKWPLQFVVLGLGMMLSGSTVALAQVATTPGNSIPPP